MKSKINLIIATQFLAASVAYGYTGEASLGLDTVVSPDIDENALRLSGHYMVGRAWSLGLAAEMGFGDPKDSLEKPLLKSLDSQYNSGLQEDQMICHLSAVKGYDYRGISVNLGAHPIPQEPSFRVYLGLGNNEYTNYQIGCFGGGILDNQKDRLGNRSEYHFSTPVSYGGVSYTGHALGLNWSIFALYQKAMTTKVSGTTDEIYLDSALVDDIAIADRPKMGLGFSYVLGERKSKVISQEIHENDSQEDSRSRRKLKRSSASQ